MLKQSLSRNQRVKGFKVKHAVQLSLLLAIFIWLVYQLNHSHGKKELEVSSEEKIFGEMQGEHGVLELGRRGLHPRAEETPADVVRNMEKEEESEEEVDETRDEVDGHDQSEGGGRGGRDEVDGHDQEKSEEESEGVEDLIDVDDTERGDEEENEEQESEEKGNDLEDQVQIQDKRYSQEAREEQYKGDDASSAVKQNIHTKISNQIEVGSLRRVKEEEVESAENFDLQKDNKASGEGGNLFGSVKNDGQTYAGSSTNTSEKPKMQQWFSLWNSDATQVIL